jgi:hypothetical protein
MIAFLTPHDAVSNCTYEAPCVCPQELIAAGDEYWLYYSLFCPWDLGDGEWASPEELTPGGDCASGNCQPMTVLPQESQRISIAKHAVDKSIKNNGLAKGEKNPYDPDKVKLGEPPAMNPKLKDIKFKTKPKHVSIKVPSGTFYANIFCVEYVVIKTGMTRYVASGFTVADAPSGTPLMGKMQGNYVCVVEDEGIFYTILLHDI